MRVLVIGGSGYLGTLTLPFLVQRHELRVFDLQPPSDAALSFVLGSVCDPAALANAVADMDAVLYMAMGSHVPLDGDDWGRIEARVEAFDVSVKGLHLALHSAHNAGVRHMVFTSSMSVYGDNGLRREGSDEEMPPDSDEIYGFTKRLGEEVCRSACRKWGMSVNALRLFLPVPEETWLDAAREGEPTPLTTAEDTARALLSALEYRAGFQAFTISGDYGENLMSLNKAKRLLDWEPLARSAKS
ncbi:MAG: NAD-dependent epimerase/dehydratase family protein [Janthinobacterium lividum]